MRKIEFYIIGDNPFNLIIDGKNFKCEIDKINKNYEYVDLSCTSSTSPYFDIKKFKEIGFQEEIEFHNKWIYCLIDASYLLKHKEDIFAIRCHHFPFDQHVTSFCIYNIDALEIEGLREDKKIEHIRSEVFRCDFNTEKDVFFKIRNFITSQYAYTSETAKKYFFK